VLPCAVLGLLSLQALGVATPQALRRQYVVEAQLSLLLSIAAMPSHSGLSHSLLHGPPQVPRLLPRPGGILLPGQGCQGAPGCTGGFPGGGGGDGGQLVSSVLRRSCSPICHLVSPEGRTGG